MPDDDCAGSVNCGCYPEQYEHNNTIYNLIKEELSFAYLKPICAFLGAELAKHERRMDDAGFDARITIPPGLIGMAPVSVELQLKGTSVPRYDSSGEHLLFSIRTSLYNLLRETRSAAPLLLFVLVLPQDIDEWVSVGDKKLTVSRHMLWYSAAGQGNLATGETVQVKIPVSNKVTKDSLYRILTMAADGEAISNDN